METEASYTDKVIAKCLWELLKKRYIKNGLCYIFKQGERSEIFLISRKNHKSHLSKLIASVLLTRFI